MFQPIRSIFYFTVIYRNMKAAPGQTSVANNTFIVKLVLKFKNFQLVVLIKFLKFQRRGPSSGLCFSRRIQFSSGGGRVWSTA